MKYDIVRILGGIACVFVLSEDCCGMETEPTKNKCSIKLYNGIFIEPPQEIAKEIQEMREKEKQEKAKRLAGLDPQGNFSPTIQRIKLPE